MQTFPKFKAFADNYSNTSQVIEYVYKRVENIAG